MQVTVNGEPADLAESTSVEDLVALRAGGQRRVAVARNGDVVPRSTWATTLLYDGDAVELLAATAGG